LVKRPNLLRGDEELFSTVLGIDGILYVGSLSNKVYAIKAQPKASGRCAGRMRGIRVG